MGESSGEIAKRLSHLPYDIHRILRLSQLLKIGVILLVYYKHLTILLVEVFQMIGQDQQKHHLFDPHQPPLYLHGLEGGPSGTKGRHILKLYGRSGPQMPARGRQNLPATPPDFFEACVQVAYASLLDRSASVLVGSSFGGAITMALLQRGLWCGPVVLLAPAIAHYGLDLKLPVGSHAIIIHDRRDDIISFAGSQSLHDKNHDICELWESDGGHRLHTITQNGTLERAVDRQIERAAR